MEYETIYMIITYILKEKYEDTLYDVYITYDGTKIDTIELKYKRRKYIWVKNLGWVTKGGIYGRQFYGEICEGGEMYDAYIKFECEIQRHDWVRYSLTSKDYGHEDPIGGKPYTGLPF